ncbi:hypothetical protein RD792_006452 [Penstemon davidsonii]|uniref:RRM domain-containing protein n=1 Tax=Penstemon davidsonii TaxID=160366 RepID=A0ABR0DD32_9LAMI|nr:hypothetical protein RD792_006452 [Penstemon davidsonii]
MEQSSKNSISGPKFQFTSIPGNEKTAWRLPGRNDGYHASSDASLFSSSLPVLTHGKLNLSESENSGQSLDDGFPSLSKVRLEDEVKDPIDETFLPDDEDELFAGLIDDFDFLGLPTQLEDLDDDIFGSGGGLEIESESQENIVNGILRLSTSDDIGGSIISSYGLTNGVGSVSGEHPYGEHPSRTLFVRNINSNVEDSELKSLFEQYGDIRTLYTACKHRGFVMISYYDIRAARNAMRGLQNKPLRRRKLDIHFSIPKDNPSEKDINQGTLVAFNLDASVSNDDLRQIFGAYGEVKEIRETPHKRHHKFIEFYDVRAAEAALRALNRSDIAGKRIKLEPSRPGGARRSPVEHSMLHGYSQTPTSLGSLSPVGTNHMPGLASILPSNISNVKIAPIGKDPTRISHLTQGAAYKHHHYSVSDSSPGPVSPFGDSNSSSIGTLSGPQFLWGSPTIHSEHISSSSSPWSSLLNGHHLPYTNNHHHGSILGSHHHVGSAPSGFQMEKHFGFFPDSPETSYINRAAFGANNFGNRAMNIGVAFAGNFTESGSPSSARMMSLPRNGHVYFGNGSFGALGATINDGGVIDRGRSRRADNGSQIDNKMLYQLDLEKIVNGEDNRTTLMIKNIPNKYTSKMLLTAIDETHKGTYDFLYLPIDFKNKCNVGYAFINMVSPLHIVTFYKAFNGKKWEKFNSEKVASLAYGRIQGKTALISHFQNSSLMNEDKRCRPILFQSQGQGTADLVCYSLCILSVICPSEFLSFCGFEPLPTGNLNIFIRQPDGSYVGDSLDSPKSDPDELKF